jgi:transposase InsO family protein
MLWVGKPAAWKEGWMDLHKNARSCPASRALLVERVMKQGWTVQGAADAAGMSERRAYVWLARFRAEGHAGLRDRSSRPRWIPHQTSRNRLERALALRRQKRSAGEIAAMIGVPRSTLARWLARNGLGRLRQLAPPEPARRYQKDVAGELIHLDVKKLGRIEVIGHRITGDRRRRSRGAGWEYVHVAIDDATRLAYAEVLENERAPATTAFLRRAIDFFSNSGVRVQALLTDNARVYESGAFVAACSESGITRSHTRPYRPCTNGKAEHFIQTLQREWAYAFAFPSSASRTALLPRYLHFYNCHRAHTSLGGKPPISTLNNVVRNYT